MIGRSRTGTGKTLAFGIPAATRLVELAKTNGNAEVMRDGTIRMRRGRLPSMIVLCPTRELARQVEEELSAVCKPLGLFSAVFHGGVSYDGQVSIAPTGAASYSFDETPFHLLQQICLRLFRFFNCIQGTQPSSGRGRNCWNSWTYH